MGLFLKFMLFTLTTSSAYIAYTVHNLLGDDPVPDIQDEFWGPGSAPGVFPKGKEDETIHPFKVEFTSPAILTDLKSRLKTELNSARFTPPLEGIGFQYGFNTNYLKKVVTYWLEKYDFSKRETVLNKYPHFKTKIGGLDIHFQHAKPTPSVSKKYKKTVPIIFVHGWPGSFVEYQKLIEHFLEPKNSEINFEIVIPSLPGYGFSQGASRPGMSTVRIANIFGRLMKRLGYERYYTLGEDWGSMISTDMAVLYPDRVKGTHFECFSVHPKDMLKHNLVTMLSPVISVFPSKRSQERFSDPWKVFTHMVKEMGYLHIQATKPDTVGVALSQSPSGLAAYILEKFSTWTNDSYMDKQDGGLTHAFTMDELLDNVMVYWVSNSITTSMRLYAEGMTKWNTLRVPVLTPTACTNPPEDLMFVTEQGLKSKFPNLKQLTAATKGGHFSAYEVPQLVAKEALNFFNNVEFNRFNEN